MAMEWRKRTYLFCCACAYLSFLLVFLGLVSSAWAEGVVGEEHIQYGAFTFCRHNYEHSRHDCGVFPFGDTSPAWFDAARVFLLMSTILLFTITPVSCYLYFQDYRREDLILLTVFAVITCIVGLLGAILYAVLRDRVEVPLSWGFPVYVSGHVIAIATFVTICCVNYCCPKKKQAIRPYYM